MMASRGDGLNDRAFRSSAKEQPDFAPGLFVIQSVQAVTRAHTSFAARTRVKIHGEGVLFTRARLRQRNQVLVQMRRRVEAGVASAVVRLSLAFGTIHARPARTDVRPAA